MLSEVTFFFFVTEPFWETWSQKYLKYKLVHPYQQNWNDRVCVEILSVRLYDPNLEAVMISFGS